MPYVETVAGRLFVQTTGQGAPITFWHCLLGDGGLWRAQTSALTPHARVVVVDGPGHGRSAPPAGAFTLEHCASAWVDVLDQAEVREPAVFAGLSWGALVALRVALRYPDRVRALVLSGSIATAPRRAARLRFTAFAHLLRTFGVTPWIARRMADMMLARSCTQQARDETVRMVQRCSGSDRRALYHAARAVLVDATDLQAELPRIRSRVVLCVGSDDRVTPVVCSRRIARILPEAELHVIDGAGHLVALEAPDALTRLLMSVVEGAPAA